MILSVKDTWLDPNRAIKARLKNQREERVETVQIRKDKFLAGKLGVAGRARQKSEVFQEGMDYWRYGKGFEQQRREEETQRLRAAFVPYCSLEIDPGLQDAPDNLGMQVDNLPSNEIADSLSENGRTFEPLDDICACACDTRVSVRMCVAEDPYSPAEVLWLLYEDQDARVRMALAQNAACPINILDRLLTDRDMSVARSAEKTKLKAWDRADNGKAA